MDNRRPSDRDPEQLDRVLTALKKSLDQLRRKVHRLERKKRHESEERGSCLIRHLDIRLHELRVDKVSGSLNIGNNFSLSAPGRNEETRNPDFRIIPERVPAARKYLVTDEDPEETPLRQPVFSPHFTIGWIRISTFEQTSSFNMGNNWMSDFASYTKQNQGFGNISGDKNEVFRARGVLHDPDFIDFLNMVGEKDGSEWIRDVIKEAVKEADGPGFPQGSDVGGRNPDDG